MSNTLFRGDYGNVSARQQLRKDLKCHDFQWYIDNVYPELYIPPENLLQGQFQIVHEDTTLCLDAMNWHAKGLPAAAIHCHGLGGPQLVRLTEKKDIRFLDGCLDYISGKVVVTKCDGQNGSQKWKKTDDSILHVETGLCLTVKTLGQENLNLEQCSDQSTQVWKVIPTEKQT